MIVVVAGDAEEMVSRTRSIADDDDDDNDDDPLVVGGMPLLVVNGMEAKAFQPKRSGFSRTKRPAAMKSTTSKRV
jgi:hypothetical protein